MSKNNYMQKITALARELRRLSKGKIPFADLLFLASRMLSWRKQSDPVLKEANRANQSHPNYFSTPVDKALKKPFMVLEEEEKRFGEED